MNIYDIKKNTIMKKLKYVKLFESFLNEELSPELQKRAMYKGFDLAKDPTRIDANIKWQQAMNISNNLSAPTRALVIKLETMTEELFKSLGYSEKVSGAKVKIIDQGLSGTTGSGKVYIEVFGYNHVKDVAECYLSIIVTKDNTEKSTVETVGRELMSDRKFVKILEDLIKEIQTSEIAKK